MTLRHRLVHGLKALLPTRRQVLPPAPRGPITTLVPVPPLAESPAPTHPDLPLIMREYHAHRRNFPQLTWTEFVKILEEREQFFGEERREREAKLARLNATPRFIQ